MPELKAQKGQMREIRVQTDPSALVRTETFGGREYLVAPVIMLVEGVLQGANAEEPEYAPADALQAFANQWNGRPVVMNHPQVQGTFVSANSPQVLEDWAFGFVFNSHFDTATAKLKAEAWIDVARAEELGGEFQDAVDRINAGEVVEVSTGLFADVLPLKGRFNNQAYEGVWTNVISDHLAILSAGVLGACSVEDGCGIPRINQEAKGPWGVRPQEMRINTAALRTIQPNHADHDGHCCETCKGAAMSTNTSASFVGQGTLATEKPKNNAEDTGGVGDGGQQAAPTSVETALVEPSEAELAVLQARRELLVHAIPNTIVFSDVEKLLREALRAKLGKNYVWISAVTSDTVVYESYEGDYCCGGGSYSFWSLRYSINGTQVTLSGEPEKVVLTTTISSVSEPIVNGGSEGAQPASGALALNQEGDTMTDKTGQPESTGSVPVVTPEPSTEGNPPVVNAAPAAEAPKAQTQSVEEYLASMPAPVAQLIRDQMAAGQRAKEGHITSILTNSSNKFPREQLEAFDLPMLENLAALAVNSMPAASDDRMDPMARFNYAGRGGIAPTPLSEEDKQRVNADTNSYGGAAAPKVFEGKDDFGPRVGYFKK